MPVGVDRRGDQPVARVVGVPGGVAQRVRGRRHRAVERVVRRRRRPLARVGDQRRAARVVVRGRSVEEPVVGVVPTLQRRARRGRVADRAAVVGVLGAPHDRPGRVRQGLPGRPVDDPRVRVDGVVGGRDPVVGVVGGVAQLALHRHVAVVVVGGLDPRGAGVRAGEGLLLGGRGDEPRRARPRPGGHLADGGGGGVAGDGALPQLARLVALAALGAQHLERLAAQPVRVDGRVALRQGPVGVGHGRRVVGPVAALLGAVALHALVEAVLGDPAVVGHAHPVVAAELRPEPARAVELLRPAVQRPVRVGQPGLVGVGVAGGAVGVLGHLRRADAQAVRRRHAHDLVLAPDAVVRRAAALAGVDERREAVAGAPRTAAARCRTRPAGPARTSRSRPARCRSASAGGSAACWPAPAGSPSSPASGSRR